jgi:hypothetical protein
VSQSSSTLLRPAVEQAGERRAVRAIAEEAEVVAADNVGAGLLRGLNIGG